MFTLKELWNDFKAWRRGERRVVPYGVQGRVYAKRVPPTLDLPGLLTIGQFKASVKPTRLWRASEGRWYTIAEDGTLTPEEEHKLVQPFALRGRR